MTVEVPTYKAAVLTEIGADPKFAMRRLPRPEPGPNEVLIRLSVTSVCGSDFGLATGSMGPTRAVLGHEGVGRIEALGSQVRSLDGSIEPGQRVGLAWNRDVCGRCAFCADLANEGETRCGARLFSGVVADGTFAQLAVAPARYLIRLPADLDAVSDEEVAPILCGGVTAYKAVKACGVTPGRFIAVCGVGGVGLLALAYARAMGYRTVGVDVSPDKGLIACGPHGRADHYVDLSQLPASSSAASTPFSSAAGDAVKKLTPGGLGVAAVIVASGAPAAYQAAFGMLAPFGTLMCVGLMPLDKTVAFHPSALIAQGWRILSSAVGTRGDILEALEFTRRRLVVPLTRPGHLEDMEQIVREVGQSKVQGKYVIRLDED
ncbi:alcohol dehydrogenase 2 [Grosmannia clavigera kw1407]|uniref:Alcohol dehydrogenase 2 n=1 Tax=Grosmannia clavigera (strain kw1407 / UAMH 11150) TaxID=655863 RepID=F0XT62_GROCL|nr:alcohol dehydrogenase 2 [Grosmannia clavigera kw1407]EFW99267.1 alcohol dehydrogenase 2 [Grosmannia clavigera kw1407]